MKRPIIILQIAATVIGTAVGAGFASGKEIIQFFTIYNESGTVGVFVSAFLMTWIGTKMMIYSRRLRAKSLNELLEHLFGKRAGWLIEWLLFLIIFGMTGVMLAGSGAVFHEQLTGNRQAGMLLIILITLFCLSRGTRGLLSVNTLVVPCLILFISVIFLCRPHAALLQGAPDIRLNGILSGIRYAAFNLMTALVVLVPLSREIEDERVLRLGGWLGGVGLGLLLLMAHLLLLAHPRSFLFEMPMAELVRMIGPGLHLGFSAVIFGEILTTYIGNIFGLARQLHSAFPDRLSIRRATLFLAAVSYLIGQFGYAQLIQTLYPLYGTLCAFLLLYLCLVRLPAEQLSE